MQNKRTYLILLVVLSGLLVLAVAVLRPPTQPAEVQAQPPDLPAFPGAQGFGAGASGGRGGQVLKVTSLLTSGQGSLQWALDQPGPRIIVFDVSGAIEGDVRIPHGDVTIAGQTAPGAGLTILGHLYTDYGADVSNIIVRHLRVRPPDPDAEWPPSQHDAIQFSTAHTIILDHVDASHGADEIIDTWGGAYSVTLQWSALTYPIYDPDNGWDHPKGIINHRACIDGGSCSADDPLGGRISIHHNLFVHCRNRTPALSTGPADVRNNVIYNGREGFVHHNIVGAASADPAAVGEFNLVGNTYVEGPSISLAPFWFDPENGSTPIPSRYWVWDNDVEDPGDFEGRVDNPFTTAGFGDAYSFYCCGIESSQFNAWGEFDFSPYWGYVPITTQGAAEAYDLVLQKAGAWPRDVVTNWALQDVQGRGGGWGNRRPADWLEGLTPGSPPTDSDEDGMADDWESAHGLNPNDGGDHDTVMPSGYTAIEEYINGLADQLVGGPSANQPPYTPADPDPADGQTNVPLDQVLTWGGGDPDGDPVTYTVAFGLASPPPVVTLTAQAIYTPTTLVGSTLYPGLISDTSYYWQITASDGLSESAGSIWSFVTLDTSSNQAPYTPSNPVPADGAVDVPTDQVLGWQGDDPDDDPVTYTLAFGPNDPPPVVAPSLFDTRYDPGPLDTDITYYWAITASDGLSLSLGPLWQFTTTAGGAVSHALYLPVVVKPPLASPPGEPPQLAGCDVFPVDNIWNTPVDGLPLDPNSDAYVQTIGADVGLHPDFGSGTWDGGPIGIPYVDVPGSQTPVAVSFEYAGESDPGPYPIPPDAPIEGGAGSDGDRHVLVLDRDACVLYELFYAWPQGDGSWQAGSGAIFDLNSHALRPDGWTSADAAGLPILPGLVRYDEVASGEIRHAIRFTAPQTRRAYVWPARHYASSLTGPEYPPMGQRFRLKADFDTSGFSPQVQVILQAFKTYGIILADNGSAWYISGVPDERWDNDLLRELRQVHGADFEAVDVSGLMLDPDSGQAGGQPD